jgi:hypothetical protein
MLVLALSMEILCKGWAEKFEKFLVALAFFLKL